MLAAAERTLTELLRIVGQHPGTRRPLHDEIVSFGERLSSKLFVLLLEEGGLPASLVDARACIRTDGEQTRATPLPLQTTRCTRELLVPLLADRGIPVLGGFVGSTLEGATTTLGRGGSELTASLIGAALAAREIQIWTDVDGFLTADPRVVPDPRVIARLSYAEAAELAYFGAKVLHPRTIVPAIEAALPIRICKSRRRAAEGSLIDGTREPAVRGLQAIAHKRGITVVQPPQRVCSAPTASYASSSRSSTGIVRPSTSSRRRRSAFP